MAFVLSRSSLSEWFVGAWRLPVLQQISPMEANFGDAPAHHDGSVRPAALSASAAQLCPALLQEIGLGLHRSD